MSEAALASRRPARFWLALAALALLLGWFGFMVLPRLNFETNLFTLLPVTAENRAQLAAVKRFADRSSRELMFFVGTADRDKLRAAGGEFANSLARSGTFASVNFIVDDRFVSAARAERELRSALLSERHRQLLMRGDTAGLEREALRAAYTPLGFSRPFGIADDPLGLASAAFDAALPGSGRARLEGDMLVVHDGTRHFTLIVARAAEDGLQIDTQKAVVRAVAEASAAARAVAGDAEVLGRGLTLFAAAGVAKSMREVAIFGGFDVLAVVVLIVGVFWLVRPLLFTLVTLGIAAAAAITVCHYVFGKIHLITLTFGTSLIGVSVDYSMHYFVNRMRSPASDAPAHDIVPALILGCTTAVAGYLTLLVAPIPGLKEIALFSAVGLATACAIVILVYPGFDRRPMPRAVPGWAVRIAEARPGTWLPRTAWLGVALCLCALAAIGWSRLKPEDSLRALMQPDPDVVAVETRVYGLLGQRFDTRFVLVTARDVEGVLQRLEGLQPVLEALEAKKSIDGYMSLSGSLASAARQAENRALLANEVYAPEGALPRVMSRLGFTDDAIAAARTEFAAADGKLLTLDRWLESPLSAPLRHLWLGQLGDEYASVVLLDHINSPAAVRDAVAQLPGIRFVDQVADLSQELRRYRVVASWVMGIVIAVMIACLLVFYRSAAAIRTALPAAIGIGLTLGALGLLQEPINLLHVLSLLLVLGLGVDYAIILREGRNHQAVLAVLLSMTTTLISFGLLGFSSVPFVRSIGITVAFGVAFTFLIALAAKPRAH